MKPSGSDLCFSCEIVATRNGETRNSEQRARWIGLATAHSYQKSGTGRPLGTLEAPGTLLARTTADSQKEALQQALRRLIDILCEGEGQEPPDAALAHADYPLPEEWAWLSIHLSCFHLEDGLTATLHDCNWRSIASSHVSARLLAFDSLGKRLEETDATQPKLIEGRALATRKYDSSILALDAFLEQLRHYRPV